MERGDRHHLRRHRHHVSWGEYKQRQNHLKIMRKESLVSIVLHLGNLFYLYPLINNILLHVKKSTVQTCNCLLQA